MNRGNKRTRNDEGIKFPKFNEIFDPFPVIDDDNLNKVLMEVDQHHTNIFFFINMCKKISEKITSTTNWFMFELGETQYEFENKRKNKSIQFMKYLIKNTAKEEKFDSIDKRLCLDILLSMKNIEDFLCTKERIIKTFYSSCSMQSQIKFNKASIIQGHATMDWMVEASNSKSLSAISR